MPDKKPLNDTYTKSEYDSALEIAKETLAYIAKFGTPPTPDVYEVWYCFAEGQNEELNNSLKFAVNEAKSVSKSQILQLRNQFFSTIESAEMNARIGNRLSKKLGGLQTIVSDQIAVSGEFDSTIGSAVENLSPETSPVEARACMEVVMNCSQEMQGHLRNATSRLGDVQREMDEMRDTLLESQKLLLTDPVTEVGNRRFFDLLMEQIFEPSTSAEKKHQFLLLMDLDHFKAVNDTHGHAAGDEVLRFVGSRLQSIAEHASVARFGGDEFAIFVESDSPAEGKRLADAICEFFAQQSLKLVESDQQIGRVTTSIGVSRLRDEDTQESWFSRADKLLYSAKQSGRSTVMIERDLAELS